jgi:Na+/glutamate symporter
MTPAEYIQMKAFARLDGVLLAVLWVSSFALYVAGLALPVLGLAAMVLMVATPFFVGFRLGKFRDEGRDGIISFRRGWVYVVFVFFYAAILLALAQYAYFAYMDHGYLMQSFSTALSTPEAVQMMKQYGIEQAMAESLEQMGQLRPIDYALNVLTVNILAGMVLGLPIAAMLQRRSVKHIN